MGWKVEVKRSAAKEIESLDKSIQRRIDAFVAQIEACEDPRQLLDRYTGPLSGYWKKRIGDYRIVCEINNRLRHQIVVTVPAAIAR